MSDYYILKSVGLIPKAKVENAFGIPCSPGDFTVALSSLIQLSGKELKDGMYNVTISLEFSLLEEMKHFHGEEVRSFLNLCCSENLLIRRGKFEFVPNAGGLYSDLWSHPIYKKYSHRLDHPNDNNEGR